MAYARRQSLRVDARNVRPLHKLLQSVVCAVRYGLTVADRDCLCVKARQAAHGALVLLQVQIECPPAGAEVRPSGNSITGEEHAPLGPMKRQVAWRVPRRLDHSKGAD